MSDSPDRRAFLKGLGVVGAAGVAASVPVDVAEAAQAAPQGAGAQAAPKPAPAPRAYVFFTAPEAAFVEAAAATFIPADELSPNGNDCGIPVFMDRQFAGAWGAGDRMYMGGPWQKGAPTQGYQLPLTPAELMRAGIAQTNLYCRKTFQKDFDRLTADQKVTVIKGLEANQIALEVVPTNEFFALLYQGMMEGFFADPMYGGNRDKVSWKMLGFPGVLAVHGQNIKNYRNKRYEAEPASIEDLS